MSKPENYPKISSEERKLLAETIEEYYAELQLQFLAGMIQAFQAWEALEGRLDENHKDLYRRESSS